MTLSAFRWHGGKFYHLEWLLPMLPPEAGTFVDVFGGAGTVLLNRPPAKVEVLNDVDHDVTTFFRVLRDDPQPLLDALRLTPWSREEFRLACEEPSTTDLEQARKFAVLTSQSIGGRPEKRASAWSSYADAAVSGGTPRTRWVNYPDRLARVADRLVYVQIECSPAVDLIPRYDRDCTLFYCDPPYVHSTRLSQGDYAHEMSDDDHAALADVLNGIKGRAAVSGYRSPLYDEIYAGWHRTDAPPRSAPSAHHGSGNAMRQESLWTNYDPSEATGQPSLFAV